jgi:hypothetical protein
MSLLHRKSNGKPIREAIEASGKTLHELAAATREADETGRGISKSAIGMLAAESESARERCRLRTAWLLATVLNEPLQDLFSMPPASTSTKERAIA